MLILSWHCLKQASDIGILQDVISGACHNGFATIPSVGSGVFEFHYCEGSGVCCMLDKLSTTIMLYGHSGRGGGGGGGGGGSLEALPPCRACEPH